jgi:hypothetical protein
MLGGDELLFVLYDLMYGHEGWAAAAHPIEVG